MKPETSARSGKVVGEGASLAGKTFNKCYRDVLCDILSSYCKMCFDEGILTMQGAIIISHFLTGCDVCDIAKSLGLSEERVRQIIRSATKRRWVLEKYSEVKKRADKAERQVEWLMYMRNLTAHRIWRGQTILSSWSDIRLKRILDPSIGLTRRLQNCLICSDINYVFELERTCLNDLMRRTRNFGKKSAQELRLFMNENGLRFRDEAK